MSTSLTKSNPKWLYKYDINDPVLNKNYRRSILYYRQLYQAWPQWCANDPNFKTIYDNAGELRKQGHDVNVDHIVPIISNIVCGLHVPWNLQILKASINFSKSNLYWPNHPFENLELF